MVTLNISPNFTIDDIRAIRTYNYEMTKDMTNEERDAYYEKECKKARMQYEEVLKSYGLEVEVGASA